MTKLLELKDKYAKLFANYETYITPVLKFILMLVTLLFIRADLGFMSWISSIPVTIVLALVGALLPINDMDFCNNTAGRPVCLVNGGCSYSFCAFGGDLLYIFQIFTKGRTGSNFDTGML